MRKPCRLLGTLVAPILLLGSAALGESPYASLDLSPAGTGASKLPFEPATALYPTTGYPSTLPPGATGDVRLASALTEGGEWISPAPTGPTFIESPPYSYGPPVSESYLMAAPSSQGWHWQLLPDGLIYRSYLAGPREPRISTVFFEEADGRTLWDPILGGRMPILRYGDNNPLRPQGWQVDVEGAAIVRLNLDANRDVDGSDFRFGFPITYGVGQWQYKFGYYHLSSHLGDEFIDRTPGATRINYVRDALVLGASYFPVDWIRLYGETAYALFTAGGAEPWEFQFGAELVEAGPTGPDGTPFLALNAHLREEIDFSGDFTLQAGWLWRGHSGHMLRTGLHFMAGKSTQYQFFRDSERQVGVGLWYDY